MTHQNAFAFICVAMIALAGEAADPPFFNQLTLEHFQSVDANQALYAEMPPGELRSRWLSMTQGDTAGAKGFRVISMKVPLSFKKLKTAELLSVKNVPGIQPGDLVRIWEGGNVNWVGVYTGERLFPHIAAIKDASKHWSTSFFYFPYAGDVSKRQHNSFPPRFTPALLESWMKKTDAKSLLPTGIDASRVCQKGFLKRQLPDAKSSTGGAYGGYYYPAQFWEKRGQLSLDVVRWEGCFISFTTAQEDVLRRDIEDAVKLATKCADLLHPGKSTGLFNGSTAEGSVSDLFRRYFNVTPADRDARSFVWNRLRRMRRHVFLWTVTYVEESPPDIEDALASATTEGRNLSFYLKYFSLESDVHASAVIHEYIHLVQRKPYSEQFPKGESHPSGIRKIEQLFNGTPGVDFSTGNGITTIEQKQLIRLNKSFEKLRECPYSYQGFCYWAGRL